MPEALSQVKRALGPDAVVLGTRTLAGGGLAGLAGRERVEITAARPEDVGRPVRPRKQAKPSADLSSSAGAGVATRVRPRMLGGNETLTASPADPLVLQLVRNEVSEALAQELVAQVRAEGAGAATMQTRLRRLIASKLPTINGFQPTGGACRRFALVGPPGAGKTTTIAKLAAQFKLREHRSVALLSLDSQRGVANDQLRRFAELIGAPMEAAQTDAAVREALKRLGPDHDLVLIDTNGLDRDDDGRFARLAALLRAAKPDEVHLALPAANRVTVHQRFAERFRPLGLTGVVFTRLDEAVGFGIMLDVCEKLACRVSYWTCGPRVTRDLRQASGDELAREMLP